MLFLAVGQANSVFSLETSPGARLIHASLALAHTSLAAMSNHTAYEITADDDLELDDEDDLVSTSGASLLPGKGKGRSVDPLAGRIGSAAPGGINVGERSTRSTGFGGIQTETR